jgi:membrane peptidoglycan carboxypeptidase
VAANKIHRILPKHELIAYDLALVSFEPGVIGVEAAAKELFGKDLKSLQLAEVAELMLALPPHEAYDELKQCRNASLIRRNRDYVLSMLVSHSLVSSERANAAQAHPVACTQLSSRLN